MSSKTLSREELSGMSVAQLKKLAKRRNVAVDYLTKKEIIDRLSKKTTKGRGPSKGGSNIPKAAWVIATEVGRTYTFVEAPYVENMMKMKKERFNDFLFDQLEIETDEELWASLDGKGTVNGWSDWEFTFLPADDMNPLVMNWFKEQAKNGSSDVF
jgi:hypothetical protein